MSQKFWLRVKEVLMKIGLKVMEGGKAFYYLHKDRRLKGAVITHMEDFNLAGTDNFIE